VGENGTYFIGSKFTIKNGAKNALSFFDKKFKTKSIRFPKRNGKIKKVAKQLHGRWV